MSGRDARGERFFWGRFRGLGIKHANEIGPLRFHELLIDAPNPSIFPHKAKLPISRQGNPFGYLRGLPHLSTVLAEESGDG